MDEKYFRIVDDLVEKGWSVCEQFFPDDYLRELAAEARQSWDSGDFREAGVGRGGELQVRPEIRSDFVTWLDPENLTPLQKTYWNTLDELRAHINRELFLGLRSFEGHFAVYPAGSFYKKHLDQFRATKHRLISCLLYLNFDWQETDGGQLRIYEQSESEETFQDIIPMAGTFACFRSEMIFHEVLPAAKERFSLTGWLRKEDAGF